MNFKLKGCNWFGSEAYNEPPNGLTEHGIEWYLDFLQKHKFNAAGRRVPVPVPVPAGTGAGTGGAGSRQKTGRHKVAGERWCV